MLQFLAAIEAWHSQAPILTGVFVQDKRRLGVYVEEGNQLLARLPHKVKRNDKEQAAAEQIYAMTRQLRMCWMDIHAETLYRLLTAEFTQYHRLSTLVMAASEEVPGLLPTKAQMDAENQHQLAHKEGLEIDQGLFFRGLLRIPSIAKHLSDAMLQPCARALALQPSLQHSDRIDLGSVLFERRGQVAYLTVNNLHCLNAEDQRLIEDMETAVDLVLLDPRVQVGLLRGGVMTHPRYRGKRVFCAGINLAELHAGKIGLVDFLLAREFGYISKLIYGLWQHSNPLQMQQKTWIAVVDAFAIGGGMQLTLAFDKVIAAEDAYFVLPAAQEGIIPGAANFRLTQMTHRRLTRQMILSGRRVYATDPDARYFCDEVVPVAELEQKIAETVHAFENPAVLENAYMLRVAEQASRADFCAYMAEFAYRQALRLHSSDVGKKIARWGAVASPGSKESMHAFS